MLAAVVWTVTMMDIFISLDMGELIQFISPPPLSIISKPSPPSPPSPPSSPPPSLPPSLPLPLSLPSPSPSPTLTSTSLPLLQHYCRVQQLLSVAHYGSIRDIAMCHCRWSSLDMNSWMTMDYELVLALAKSTHLEGSLCSPIAPMHHVPVTECYSKLVYFPSAKRILSTCSWDFIYMHIYMS